MLKRIIIVVTLIALAVTFYSVDLSAYYFGSVERYVPSDGGYGIQSDIVGSNRVVVTDSTVSPYSAIAYIHADFPSCTECVDGVDENGEPYNYSKKAGTGFMISPTCMVTAAHNLVCDHGNMVEELRVYFKCTESYDESKPYFRVTPSTASINVLEGYTGKQNDKDAGYVVFNTSYTGTTKFFTLYAAPDNFFGSSTNITVSGHSNRPMYTATGKARDLQNNGTRFYHSASTKPGESGGPVYMTASSTYVVVGIHTNGYSKKITEPNLMYNTAWRITQDFIDMVKGK